METQQFCLKWNSHQANMLAVFEQLLSTEALVDVTLACDGLSLKAHKVVLSACSPYFQSLFVDNPCKHPIVIMKDMRYTDLKAIIDFMYKGEVNVSHDQLNALLKTAETLKVKGLAEMSGEHNRLAPATPIQQTSSSPPPSVPVSQTRSDSPALLSKRKHGRPRKRFRSGSIHSDEEIVPTKIKEPESPEIEELPQDTSDSISDNIPSSKHQTPVHSSNAVNNSHLSRKSQSSRSSQRVTEEPSDGDFSIEPSKLMEQTLTTAPVISNGLVQTSTPSGISVNTSSSLSIVPSSLSIVPTSCESQLSVATDSHSSNQTQGPDSPQDVKPLLSFEEPLISIDPSQDGSSFMDSSGVPAIAGTSSSYHEDQTALVPQDSQSQGAGDAMGNTSLKKCKYLLQQYSIYQSNRAGTEAFGDINLEICKTEDWKGRAFYYIKKKIGDHQKLKRLDSKKRTDSETNNKPTNKNGHPPKMDTHSSVANSDVIDFPLDFCAGVSDSLSNDDIKASHIGTIKPKFPLGVENLSRDYILPHSPIEDASSRKIVLGDPFGKVGEYPEMRSSAVPFLKSEQKTDLRSDNSVTSLAKQGAPKMIGKPHINPRKVATQRKLVDCNTSTSKKVPGRRGRPKKNTFTLKDKFGFAVKSQEAVTSLPQEDSDLQMMEVVMPK